MTIAKSKILSNDQLWDLIDQANWQTDHDYARINHAFRALPESEFNQIAEFIGARVRELDDRFKNNCLNNEIKIGDDGWLDLRSEVVGRGKDFFESITVDKLRKLAEEQDYYECFSYVTH